MTKDKWILQVVQEGLRLQFKEIPKGTGTKETNLASSPMNLYILEEVHILLEKNVVEVVPKGQESQGFYSTFFVVQKKDGSYRPILNLRNLNTHLQVPHFKMETLKSITAALRIGEWAFTLDLQDAYLHIPVYQYHRQYLRFCVQGHHYQFRAMPFGLATAPRIFTKFMSAIGSFLHTRQIFIHMYLDDWLVRSQDKKILLKNQEFILSLLDKLGLLVNWKKSNLVPSQTIQYLGAIFNFQLGLIYPTEDRHLSLLQAIARMENLSQVSAQWFLRLLGLMTACIGLVPAAHLHMRPIQFYLLHFWRSHKDSLDSLVPIRQFLVDHLQWWKIRQHIFVGVPLQEKHSVTLWTDASVHGWGAHMDSLQVSGRWAKHHLDCHINWLEMKAVQLALEHFKQHVRNQSVLLRCDNSTVVSYINKQGGTKSFNLCLLTWELLQWCQENSIVLKAAHIPGKRNILADDLSRGKTVIRLTEWSLNQEIADTLFKIFPTPNLDLFATKENRKLQVYCSPYPDPEAIASDALSIDWTGMWAYAYPPPILIPLVLKKIQDEQCKVLLIAPLAPNRPWFPLLLELLVDFPRRLPHIDNLLSQNRGQVWHPNPATLNLGAWVVSKDKALRKDFLRRLSNISVNQGVHQLENCITHDWLYTENSAGKDMWIPVQHL